MILIGVIGILMIGQSFWTARKEPEMLKWYLCIDTITIAIMLGLHSIE